jgi:AraC family transcriptional regulator of adaptative response/methylated-DNA-[protein]-cysteine methyltransferase
MSREAVIANIIDYLAAHHTQQPDLDFLAKRAGYESTHFQKIFSEHVGISPKRLVQYMNARHARELLSEGRPTLETAYETGLSGNGRLHDLFISCEAMTPGDIGRRGAGLKIVYGFSPTQLGEVMVAKTARGICYLGFLMKEQRTEPVRRMKRWWPLAKFEEDDVGIKAEGEIIAGLWRGEGKGKLKLDVYGTNFQIQVWQALLKIPMGETVTYQDIAAQIGRPKSSRAVGNAVGANPVSLLIPCHRVIRATGIIDNYGWGSPRKKLILAMESGCHLERNAEGV